MLERPGILRALRLALAGLLILAAPAAGQGKRLTKGELRKLPYNHPAQCPHTGGDPELLAKLGIVSTTGGFEFGDKDTKAVEELMPTTQILWAETDHFRIGFGLGACKVSSKEKRKVQAELEELTEILPDLNTRTRSLDPWLRLILTCRRMEAVYDRFLEVVQVEEDAFPEVGEQYMLGTPFMGLGPYVGMKSKYEILVVPSEAQLSDFLADNFGLQMRYSQRWHHIERGALTIVCHARQGSFRVDEALHAHLAFNIAFNLLDGYKHYAYDLPIWLREGFAHAIEREISERYNSFDGGEGVAPPQSNKENWKAEVVKVIGKGDAPRMSELIRMLAFGELSIPDHYVIWSMTRFLMDEHTDGYACLLGTLKGSVDEQGYPDGSGMADRHREAFKSCIGMSYAEFDRAWTQWATGTFVEDEEAAKKGQKAR